MLALIPGLRFRPLTLSSFTPRSSTSLALDDLGCSTLSGFTQERGFPFFFLALFRRSWGMKTKGDWLYCLFTPA